MAEEIPFNTAQRTWERADIIACGVELLHAQEAGRPTGTRGRSTALPMIGLRYG
jgi:hypothetical protein